MNCGILGEILPQTEIDDSMQKVKGWLFEEGIFKEEIKDDQTNYNYQVELIPNSGNLLHIIQPKMSKDL